MLVLSLLQCAPSSDYLAPEFNKGFESEFMDEMDQDLYPKPAMKFIPHTDVVIGLRLCRYAVGTSG